MVAAPKYESLRIRPISFRDACDFVTSVHRHHKPPQGHKFSIAVVDGVNGDIRGVGMVGRPVSRMLDDGLTAEVIRLCTDGTPNACSALYGACARAAKAMGYLRIVTYILGDESGTSLRASGFQCDGGAGGGSWGRSDRPREDKHPTQRKTRWTRVLGTPPSAVEDLI